MHGLADIVLTEWDHRLVLQCHRGVLFISAAELVAIVNPLKINSNRNTLVRQKGDEDDVIKKEDATVEELSSDDASKGTGGGKDLPASANTEEDNNKKKQTENEDEDVLKVYLKALDAAEKEEMDKTAQDSSKILRNNWVDNDQVLLIDLRSQEEAALSGGGLLPRGIPLEPSVLDHPDAFSAWLEHVSGSKGKLPASASL